MNDDTPTDPTNREHALDQLAAESQEMGLYGEAPKYDLDVTLANGKYRVRANHGMNFHALRYGERWRDLTGDGMVLALAMEVAKLREEVEVLRIYGDKYCTVQADKRLADLRGQS